jgi:hypothetical protein
MRSSSASSASSLVLPAVLFIAAIASTGGCAADSASSEPESESETEEQGLTGDRRIDPIEVGHAWTYDVRVLGWYPICSPGRHTSRTLESVTVGGRAGKRVESLCPGAGSFVYSVEGDRVWSRYAGAWRRSVDSPVRAGHTWSDDYFDYVWDRVGNVTTPAGTFTSCWKARKLVSYESYTVFCRGVGPVRWHYEDGWGNGYDATLTSKNF